jgi:outer membrane protein TolC
MWRKSAAFCAALAAVILVTTLSAQEGGFTLEKAVEIAQSRNPDVLAARTAIEAARGRTLQLKARPEPSILASVEGVPIPGLKKRATDRGQPRDRTGLRIPWQALSEDGDQAFRKSLPRPISKGSTSRRGQGEEGLLEGGLRR